MLNVDRKIYLIGDIDHEAHIRFTRKLSRLECESDEPVTIVLSSDGGYATVALALYDRIKLSRCPIHITATGLVASAAVLVLAAGDTRCMTRSAWVMVHDDTAGIPKNARVSQARKHVTHGRRMERQWNHILSKVTATSADKWDELHKNETYLSPKECLMLGLIEEIYD